MTDPKDMLTFAIDPGTIDTGVCLALGCQLLETKTIHVPKSWKALDRTLAMMDKIEEYIMEHYSSRFPQTTMVHIAYEGALTFHGQNGAGRPILALHNLIVLIEYWARQEGIKTYPYNVNDIKIGIAGSPRASKQEVEYIMKNEWDLRDAKKSNHEFDAISILTFHLRQLAVQAAIIPETVR